MLYHRLLSILAFCVGFGTVQCQNLCPVPNHFNYHNDSTPTIRSFQGQWHSNYNETITFCNFKAKSFELNDFRIISVLAQTHYGANTPFTSVGAILDGAAYTAGNGSIVWHGFGFSATGPYNCAFALNEDGTEARGYYTYTNQKDGATAAGETGPWILHFQREPTYEECQPVYRSYTMEDYETGCTSSGTS
jgi:hypothetical protein